MVDEFPEEGGGDGAVEEEGVPVLFVHVVAGQDAFWIPVSEFQGSLGVTFQIHPRGEIFRDGEGE